MDQPPPPLGSVAHPQVAAAAAAVAREASSLNIGHLMGQLLHGYLLVDTTANPPQTVDGVLPAGSTFGFRTLLTPDDRIVLPVFTSSEQLISSLPPADRGRASSMVLALLRDLALLTRMNAVAILIDPAGVDLQVSAEPILRAIDGVQNTGVRAALALSPGPQREATILETLRGPGDLVIGVDPSTVGPNGDLGNARSITASTGGTSYLAAFTSQTELILFGQAVPLQGTVQRVLESSLEHEGSSGLVLNPASESAILPRDTVQRLLADRSAG